MPLISVYQFVLVGVSDPPMIAADLQVAVITPDRLLTVPLALDNMAEFDKLEILLQSLPFPSADLLSILLSDRKGECISFHLLPFYLECICSHR